MSDRYLRLVGSRPGSALAGRLGLPRPVTLARHRPGDPVIRGRVLLGGPPPGRLLASVLPVLLNADARLAAGPNPPLRALIAAAGGDAASFDPEDPAREPLAALIFDASAISDSVELAALHSFFHPSIRRLERCGRIIVLATPPADCGSVHAATAQRALEGFTRSVGKEVGRGCTVQLVYVAPGGEDAIASTLRFLLSPRSAYVSGQVVHVGSAVTPGPLDWEQPFAGRVALVTGASRGIGEATARLLAGEGAHVVGVDVPGAANELRAVTGALQGDALALDISSPDAAEVIAAQLSEGVDVVVHNAGVTRDRTLAKMPSERWSELMEINLSAQERIDEELLAAGALRENGRIVCLSSMSAIAGNAGQSNYATSKAGVIGRVQALAPELAKRDATINAVAPGFIETAMTARMPIAIREAGRRMSSLGQGGLPIDVAETIAWLAHPWSGGINGSVVRVCGQNFLGA